VKNTTYLAKGAILRASVASAVLGLALASAPAFAQAADDESSEDLIIVTGSRIARPDIEAAVPVTVVSAEDIVKGGTANVQEVLIDLPAVGQSVSRTSSNFSTTGNGQATVNLRNLGSARTLVLVNGRRFVAGIPGTSIVDLNTIPTDLIKQVDVVTGGASAVYGSEAISGVVNFTLDDKFEGIGARAQGTVSSKGDAGRQYVSLKLGNSFADDRGHVVLYGQYDKDHGLRSRNRAFSARDIPNRSSFASQGLFSVDGSFAAGANTYTFDSANNLKNYQGANVDGYNRNADRYLGVPVQRYMFAGLANYEFSNSVTAYFEGEYAKTKSNSSLEPQAVAYTDLPNAAGIPITNPFIPAAIKAAMINAGETFLPFRRRSNDIFDRSNKNDRSTWRIVAGLKGEIAENLNWDIYYTHGQTKDFTASGTILGPNYENAINAVAGVNGPVCSINVDADPNNNDAKCVPINIFGSNTVDPRAAAYVTNNGQLSTYDARVKQDVLSATLTGKAFTLPGGDVSFAVGGEYRKENSSEDFDTATNLGLTLGNQLSDTRGKFNVKEAFAEVVVPLLKDRPFFQYLGFEGAVRYADYSTVGGVMSWKVGGEWAPISDFRLRGIYSEATRAPNISELFSAQSETFPAVVDPCDQRKGEGDGAPLAISAANLAAACKANPAIAAAAASANGFVYSTAQIQTINGFVGGNPGLREEKAKTLTLGAVFQPRFLSRFSTTVDYYRIRVIGAIGIIGQQTSLDECINGSGLALFCNNIIRDGAGRVQTINAINLNTGSYLVSGVDTQVRYTLPVGSSRIDLSVNWNHRLKQQQTSFPGGPTQPELGQLDCYSCGRLGTGFKDRVNASLSGKFGGLSVTYKVNYLGPVVDDLTKGANALRVKSYFYHDAQVRYDLGEDKKFAIYFGVDNMFDKKPPVFNDTNPVTFPGTQTSANTYDLYGRMLYAGVEVKF
jgi:outer membrane receptor protein involved in Fe transport